MVKIIDRHIERVVIYSTLFVLLVLAGLQIFVGFIAQLGSIGSGNYGVLSALIYIVETLPQNVYSFFPMVGLLGSLLGLGYLASNSELIVMRSSGMSLWQITWAVLKAAILMLIIMTIIGEVVAPYANHAAIDLKASAEAGGSVVKTTRGLWMRRHNDFIHINQIQAGKRLQGVSQYIFNGDNYLLSSSYAENAVYQNGRWQLQKIERTQFDGNKVSTQQIAQAPLTIKIDPNLLKFSLTDPSAISLIQLSQLIQFQRRHGLQEGNFTLVFWQRIFQPIAALIMIFLAIPFIFGPLRSSSMGSRILIGVVVGFIFYLLNQFFGPFSVVYQIPPVVGALAPILVFCAVAFFLLRRVG